MRYRLTWSAQRDIDAIHTYIASDSPHHAASMIEDLFGAAGRLLDFPYVGVELPDAGVGLRFVRVGSYRIYYQIDGDVIVIKRVLHGAQDADCELGATGDE